MGIFLFLPNLVNYNKGNPIPGNVWIGRLIFTVSL